MARLKRSSAVLEKATLRIAGMGSISPTPAFAHDLNLTEYNTRIQALQTQLTSYNAMLSKLDGMAEQLKQMEQELSNYSERMLMSVATQYGKSSVEYMQAGGSMRKRSSRHSSNSTSVPTVDSLTKLTSPNGKGAIVN